MEDWLTHVDTLFNQTTVDVSGKKKLEEVPRKERRSAQLHPGSRRKSWSHLGWLVVSYFKDIGRFWNIQSTISLVVTTVTITTGWWYTYPSGIHTPLKNMSSSVGMMKFPTEWKVIVHSCSNHQPVLYTHPYSYYSSLCSKPQTRQLLFTESPLSPKIPVQKLNQPISMIESPSGNSTQSISHSSFSHPFTSYPQLT